MGETRERSTGSVTCSRVLNCPEGDPEAWRIRIEGPDRTIITEVRLSDEQFSRMVAGHFISDAVLLMRWERSAATDQEDE